MKNIQIAASLLASDQLNLMTELASIKNLVDRIHLDVMDGHMVPNMALNPAVIRAIPDDWQRDIHLMVINPEEVSEWLDLRAGDTLYFHSHAAENLQKFIESLNTRGVVPGFAIDLDFPLEENVQLLATCDSFLVMGVKPGFSGQTMNINTVNRVQWLKERFPQTTIAVDGGVNNKNALQLVKTGADILVVGSYLFRAQNRAEAIKTLF